MTRGELKLLAETLVGDYLEGFEMQQKDNTADPPHSYVGGISVPLEDFTCKQSYIDWRLAFTNAGRAAYRESAGREPVVSEDAGTASSRTTSEVSFLFSFKDQGTHMAKTAKGNDDDKPGEFGKKYDSGMPEEHKTQDTSKRHPQDSLLRKHGFAIHARPRKGPNIWIRNGRQFEESLALEMAHRSELAAKAEKQGVKP